MKKNEVQTKRTRKRPDVSIRLFFVGDSVRVSFRGPNGSVVKERPFASVDKLDYSAIKRAFCSELFKL